MSDERGSTGGRGSRPSPPRSLRVAVVGAGSWGTALALHAAGAGHEVRLWGHDADRVDELRATRENRTYLPGFRLPESLFITADAATALRDAELVLSVVPSRFLREVWEAIGDATPPPAHLVSATKGIERGTGLRMTELLRAVLPVKPASISALSGPSFARELAEGHPTAVTLGCEELDSAAEVQVALSHGPLRVYRNTDLPGVELGGALKNVIAIAAGISDGLGLGSNSRAALVCRGLKEMSVLAECMGARAQTLMGLAGLGDLVLTCTGPLSRNRQVGVAMGEGRSLEEATRDMHMEAEGLVTVRSARELAARHSVDMPITAQVHAVLYEGQDPRRGIDELLSRALVEE